MELAYLIPFAILSRNPIHLKHPFFFQGSDGTPILSSGRFVVALTHADATLHNTSLPSYIEEISGDPLHTLITEHAKGKVLALNNSPDTEYEKEQHRMALQNRIFLNSSNIGSSQSYLPWHLWEWIWSQLPAGYGYVHAVFSGSRSGISEQGVCGGSGKS